MVAGGGLPCLDLFFDDLPTRGHHLTDEQAWWEINDVLEGLAVAIFFAPRSCPYGTASLGNVLAREKSSDTSASRASDG